MQWKQDLRRALENQGHRIAPITRISPATKRIPLAQSENEYRASCFNCELNLTIKTKPACPVHIDGQIYEIKCRKACRGARKEASSGS